MGLKWTATLMVEFEMLDGRPDSLALAQTVPAREAGLLKHNIEHGRELATTGVKPKSAKVQILSQGQRTINFAVCPAPVRPCASRGGLCGTIGLKAGPNRVGGAMLGTPRR
jgi:hypothetical protein